ncbi:MAG: hypothetical protein N3C12_10150 [Candidatus Binatia bacterium]|nr:hypothetical protein [Candidatus Binatia bacterium]
MTMRPARRNLKWLKLQEKSNRIGGIRLQVSPRLRDAVTQLAPALATASPAAVEPVVQTIADEICRALAVPPVGITVELARPRNHFSELHGLYTLSRRSGAQIRLWMLTAKRKQVAAFKTFLRTLLHELCHHLDYTLLRLGGSVHCEGFYKRESSLFHQLTAHLGAVPPMNNARPSR